LSNYLKNEFKDSFINGAMMDFYNKYFFFENLAYKEDFYVRPYYKDKFVNVLDNILITNHIPDSVFNNPAQKVHSAWWYHCFSMDTVKEKGLPLPMFIRGDDIEWSLRNFGKHHISMNGISVWHIPFVWRESKTVRYYYSTRNYFMKDALYMDGFKENYQKYLFKDFKYLFKTYDYVSLDLFLYALDDILKGSSAFIENPSELLQKLSQISKVEYHNTEDLYEMWNAQGYKRKVSFGRKLLYSLTNRGLYCPKIFMRSRCIALEWGSLTDNFIMVKEVKVYNTNTNKYEVRRFDRTKLKNYKKAFHAKLKAIEQNYDKLRNDYIESHKEFATIDFWEKYLELK
jgi:hypothetical protein